jgi:hypothetical protein
VQKHGSHFVILLNNSQVQSSHQLVNQFKCLFESVIVIVFQSIFHAEKH